MAGVQQEKTISNKSCTYDSEGNNMNYNNNCLYFILFLLLYLFRNTFPKNRKLLWLFFIFSSLVPFYFRIFFPNDFQESFHNKLKKCQNVNFFSIESIQICNNITLSHNQSNISLITITKLKFNHHRLFVIFMLLLSNDICTNPGPIQNQSIDQQANTWAPFKKHGLHFFHLNINSLLPKIDEVRDIIRQSKPAVFGISESKLDNTVADSEINVLGYSLIRVDRDRRGGGVACYIRNDISFNIVDCLSKNIEGVMFDLLLPKTKSISVGIFYRPPNQGTFLETLTNDLEKINLNGREIFFLGDFNVNLIKNGKYVFDKKCNIKGDSYSPLVKDYKEFCSVFSFKQLIKNATRIFYNNTSSLLDHILTNSLENISQSGIINIGISDHLLIYCTRKIKSLRSFSHKEIKCRSLKRYNEDDFKKILNSIEFPNYETFNDVNRAYDDFFEKLINAINKIAPMKVTRMKNDTPDWFDLEISEKIDLRKKLLRKFKRTKLDIDKELYTEARNKVLRVIK